MVKGREIMFRLSDKPVNEGCIRHICSPSWEDPVVLKVRNKQSRFAANPLAGIRIWSAEMDRP